MKFFAPPAYSFSGKPDKPIETTPMTTPGPGTYDIREEPGRTALISPLKDRENPFKPINPGPGSYELGSIFSVERRRVKTKLNAEKIREGNRLKDLKERVGRGNADFPGPGAYSPLQKEFSPATSIGQKTYAFIKEMSDVPGPGAYSPEKPNKRLEVTMKSSLRSTITEGMGASGPGPAAYSTRSNGNSPIIKFGTEAKMVKSSSSQGIPGPGSYSPPSLFSKTQNAPIFAGKDRDSKREDLPGPGAYSPKAVLPCIAPVFGTGSRSSYSPPRNQPGPGEYDPVHPVHAPSHLACLDLSSRKPVGSDKSPGPGAYALYSSFNAGTKVSLSGRRSDYSPEKQVPGPGAYEPNYAAVLGHAPKAALGSGKRSTIVMRAEGPGPVYDTRRKPEPPYWRIAKEGLKVRRPPDDVGPGTYDIPAFVPDAPRYRSTKK
jgi:hypothetical protein